MEFERDIHGPGSVLLRSKGLTPSTGNSRWAVVVASRFDWFPKPLTMRSHSRGEIVHLPSAAIEMAVNSGALVRIAKPDAYKVDKSGRVVRCDSST